MKLRLVIEAEVDEAGLAAYYERYPELAALDERDPEETLYREALAVWEWEDLVKWCARLREVRVYEVTS